MSEAVPHDPHDLLSAAELYLCLSRAFQLGQQPITLAQMREELLPDLQQLAETLPVVSAQSITQLDDDLKRLPDTDALMREFSRLFLMPPAPAPLNLGFYLDGGMMGNTPVMLEACYHRYGLEKSAGFHDVPDHLSLILHWLGWVYAQINEPHQPTERVAEALQDTTQVIALYALPGLNKLIGVLESRATSAPLGSVWLHLLQLLQTQLQQDLARLRGMRPEQRQTSAERAVTTAVPKNVVKDVPTDLPIDVPMMDEGLYGKHADVDRLLICQQCGCSFAAGRILAEMISRLQMAGVSARHVEICESCRDTGDKQGRSSVVLQQGGCQG